jgi:diguanylate cyclase (GGDEF)-like protein
VPVATTLRRLIAAEQHNRRLALFLAVPAYAGVFAAFVLIERPGLGIGHFFYLPICLVALATDELLGAAAGVFAAALYAAAVILAPDLPAASILTSSTSIRLVTFVGIGALVGRYSRRNRTLVAELRRHARQDFLTGIGNVRMFDEEIAERCGAERPFTLVLADLDDFGRVNDMHGHEAGNAALCRVAEVLRENSGPAAVVARIGGDEFALLTYRPSDQAAQLCGRLTRALAAEDFHVSFGTTSYPADGATPVELFRKADDRLFAAKLLNRNRRTVVSLVRS